MSSFFQQAVERGLAEYNKRKPETVLGYALRKPYAGEDEYFRANPNVAGMAAEDGRIVLNPHSKNSAEGQRAVAKNEAIRLWMRENKTAPDFELTPEQMAQFEGTEYGKPENALNAKHTIIARILTGDPSAKKPTEAQLQWAERVRRSIPNYE